MTREFITLICGVFLVVSYVRHFRRVLRQRKLARTQPWIYRVYDGQ